MPVLPGLVAVVRKFIFKGKVKAQFSFREVEVRLKGDLCSCDAFANFSESADCLVEPGGSILLVTYVRNVR